MRHVTAVRACAVAICVVAAPANADIFNFQFPIDQSQEIPMPAHVPGAMGVGDVDYDSNTNMLSWNISFVGLSGPSTGAHFHGPALPGQTAGVQLSIGAISGLSSPMIGSAPITEEQESDLLAGKWYVNIHTALNGPGEIRGQVIPAPGAVMLFAAAGGIAIHRRRRS